MPTTRVITTRTGTGMRTAMTTGMIMAADRAGATSTCRRPICMC